MESIWKKTCRIKERPSLNGDLEVEAVVIGAGMTGILTAYELQQAGIDTVVLEADRIGSGQTGNTTAKITSQHGLLYAKMKEKKGISAARAYAHANQQAIAQYKQIIEEEKISCDFEETSSYVYVEDEEKLEKEAEAARMIGLPAFIERSIEIPVTCAGAVKFSGQAQFHPLKFINALSENLHICERTFVRTVEDNRVLTDKGTVKAAKIIFASHFPFVNFPGMYFARMHQERSYVLALSGAGVLEGMYIGEGKNTYSFRRYENYILFGGQGHRTGENKEGGNYERLRRQTQIFFPGSREVAHWSAQDCMPGDGIPFIGQYAKDRPDWYVATGFGKWGMTSAMVSAQLIRDMLLGVTSPEQEVFSPERYSAQEFLQTVKDGGKSVKELSKSIFLGQACPHLGCHLKKNPEEDTYDCPCHGSRFDSQGNLLEGPALKSMKCARKEL